MAPSDYFSSTCGGEPPKHSTIIATLDRDAGHVLKRVWALFGRSRHDVKYDGHRRVRFTFSTADARDRALVWAERLTGIGATFASGETIDTDNASPDVRPPSTVVVAGNTHADVPAMDRLISELRATCPQFSFACALVDHSSTVSRSSQYLLGRRADVLAVVSVSAQHDDCSVRASYGIANTDCCTMLISHVRSGSRLTNLLDRIASMNTFSAPGATRASLSVHIVAPAAVQDKVRSHIETKVRGVTVTTQARSDPTTKWTTFAKEHASRGGDLLLIVDEHNEDVAWVYAMNSASITMSTWARLGRVTLSRVPRLVTLSRYVAMWQYANTSAGRYTPMWPTVEAADSDTDDSE